MFRSIDKSMTITAIHPQLPNMQTVIKSNGLNWLISVPVPLDTSMRDVLAIACFALSGFAGLVYEIVWIRQATLVFGSTTLAVSSVLAVFFLGLAIGSALFGGIATRTARPLLLFALIEAAIGCLALVTPAAFELVSMLYGGLHRALGGGWSGWQLARARAGRAGCGCTSAPQRSDGRNASTLL